MEQNSHRYNEGNNPNQKEPSNAERTDQPFNNKKKKKHSNLQRHINLQGWDRNKYVLLQLLRRLLID